MSPPPPSSAETAALPAVNAGATIADVSRGAMRGLTRQIRANHRWSSPVRRICRAFDEPSQRWIKRFGGPLDPLEVCGGHQSLLALGSHPSRGYLCLPAETDYNSGL